MTIIKINIFFFFFFFFFQILESLLRSLSLSEYAIKTVKQGSKGMKAWGGYLLQNGENSPQNKFSKNMWTLFVS